MNVTLCVLLRASPGAEDGVRPGYSKRLRALAATMGWLIAVPARWSAAARGRLPAAVTWPDAATRR